ncbi:unnamed protein product [Scytosiphon promiscuus]
MAEILIGSLAWGALRLTSSLVTAGFNKLIGSEDDSPLVEWSGDVVVRAHEISNQQQHAHSGREDARRNNNLAEIEGGLSFSRSDLSADSAAIGTATATELAMIRSEVRAAKFDLASVRETVENCRQENAHFYKSCMDDLAQARKGIRALQKSPLAAAEMNLQLYVGSKGDAKFLEAAQSKALEALSLGNSLDTEIRAAVVAISAGYISVSKSESPRDAKHFTVHGTLVNISNTLAPVWADPSRATSPDGKKTLSFLLNVVSSVCVLPPEDEPVVPHLDKRLLLALGGLCSADLELRSMYPELATTAMRAMLEENTIRGLLQLADEVHVDVDSCITKREMVEALLDSGKRLVNRPATASTASTGLLLKSTPVKTPVFPEAAATPPQSEASSDRDAPSEFFGPTQTPSQENNSIYSAKAETAVKPDRSSSSEGLLLLELFASTNGLAWKKNTAWGTSAPLEEWHGVSVDDAGRVVKLDLGNNELTGTIPARIGGLTALDTLFLNGNKLSGPIPSSLSGLTALQNLQLFRNNLSGGIPPGLGRLTALRQLGLSQNKLVGPIPPELGRLGVIEDLQLYENQLDGSIPAEMGRLTALRKLDLSGNNLRGPIPPELGGLTALQRLQLENNRLSGLIPPSVGGLTALQRLQLENNKLGGLFPRELARLKALKYASFFGNNLSGNKAQVKRLLPRSCSVYWRSSDI